LTLDENVLEFPDHNMQALELLFRILGIMLIQGVAAGVAYAVCRAANALWRKVPWIIAPSGAAIFSLALYLISNWEPIFHPDSGILHKGGLDTSRVITELLIIFALTIIPITLVVWECRRRWMAGSFAAQVAQKAG